MQTIWRRIRPLAARPYLWALDRLRPFRPDYPAVWRGQCQHWYIDVVNVGPRTEIAGWIFPPEGVSPGFTWNGRRFDRLLWPLERPDMARWLPFEPAAGRCGFHALTKLGPDAEIPEGPVVFEAIDTNTGKPLGEQFRRQYYFAGSVGELPDATRRKRVIADDSELSFRFGGYNCFRTFEDLLTAATGRTYRDCRRVLDWGCGCGRVARHFRSVPGLEVFGADVDPDNIAFCRETLPEGTFETVPLLPPTRFASSMFDLVIGVSVFTHLSESVQFAWLEELRRVTRPGAAVIMSHHGPSSLVYKPTGDAVLRSLAWRGIAEGPYVGYDADIGDPEYYRSTWHTTAYIRKVWGRYFDVLAVYPCAQAHQDVVVMRRR